MLQGMASDAREVAARLSIPVLELIPGEAAGERPRLGGAAEDQDAWSHGGRG